LGEEKVKNFLEETQMEGNLVDLRLGYILEKKNNQALNNPVNIMEPYL
jgi:hypothetical protein